MYDFTDIGRYPIAILGGGSVGRTCAADCKLAGNTVRLFDIQPFAEKSLQYLEKTGVTLVGTPKNKYGFSRLGNAKFDMVTDDMAKAVDGVKLILVCIPSVAHEAFFEQLAPLLKDGQIVHIIPDNYGSLRLRKKLREIGSTARVIVGGWSSAPYGTRIVTEGGVPTPEQYLVYRAITLRGAALPDSDSDDLLESTRYLGCFDSITQEDIAEMRACATEIRQRWENGETVPNTETLKLLSKLFDVSINTLLGAPRRLICQCCGMPLEDALISREKDGTPNENYCKWCYADGTYTYGDMDDLIDVCVRHMVNESFSEEQARAYLKQLLPTLDYWKRYEELSDNGQFEAFKQKLIEEINGLHIEGMPRVEKLNALVGQSVNLAYRLPNGDQVKFLDDQTTYLGNQLESEFGGERCFGVLANMEFILVCTYEKEGTNPELVLYKKR